MEGSDEPLMGAQRMLLSAPDFSVTECFALPDRASQQPPKSEQDGNGGPLGILQGPESGSEPARDGT